MRFEYLKTQSDQVIEDVKLIIPEIYRDKRGLFFESWNQNKFNKLIGKDVNFVQDNHSVSCIGCLRGLHFQLHPSPQGKLVRCINGVIFDIALDIRKSSKTYGRYVSTILNNTNRNLLWIPEGFAHGFLALEEKTEVLYKTTNFWYEDLERSLNWEDKDINIKWPFERIKNFKLNISNKDSAAPLLKDLDIKGELFI